MNGLLLLLIVTIVNCNESFSCHLEFIAAYGRKDSDAELISRSAATYGKTVRFTKVGQSVSWNFTTHSSTCNFDVLNVVYSNDGPADNLTLYLDQKYVGDFQTIEHTNEGVFWNQMVESGLIGRTKVLSEGNHLLKLVVGVTDIYGVEIDKIEVGVLCGSEGDCSVKIDGAPTDQQGLSGESGGENWNTETIISLAVGLISTAISTIIAIPAFILAVWSIYKCAKGGKLRKKTTTRISRLKKLLVEEENLS